MGKATALPDNITTSEKNAPVIGVFCAGDPRIDADSRQRCRNIVRMAADVLAERVKLPDGSPVKVVYASILVDGEKQADIVARQFQDAGVKILVCTPDTWAFPQLSVISLLQQFPEDTPINFTCGNSGPKPGVVFAHAVNGALAQYGRLSHLNVGTWPDTGLEPQMTQSTADALVDWAFAAVTTQALKGSRVVVFGHDSMGMETALAHVIPTRKQFGIEITRLDMKLLADMLAKKSYDDDELKTFRAFVDKHLGKRLEIRDQADSERFDQSLALYLIMRDLLKDLNAVGGGFMSQLEWGSDARGIPLPVADAMESFFNSTFDHNGPKMPDAVRHRGRRAGAAHDALLLRRSPAANPPLFMDFRKVWEKWELEALAKKLGDEAARRTRSGRRRDSWTATTPAARRSTGRRSPARAWTRSWRGVSMPLADAGYFPGMGNSVTYVSPGGLEGIAGRLTFSSLSEHVQPELGRGHDRRGPGEARQGPLRRDDPILAAHVRRAEVRVACTSTSTTRRRTTCT